MHESLAEIESRKEKEHQLPLHILAAAMDQVATDPVKLDPRGYTYGCKQCLTGGGHR